MSEDARHPIKRGLVTELIRLPSSYWMLNVMELLERISFFGVRALIPIYIAQADETGGLHFSQSDKGLIFMLWALMQAGVPVLSGGFADRYGFKKSIVVSIVLKIIGFVLMATQREFWPFTAGCLTLAIGSGIWNPGLTGSIQGILNNRQSSIGWGGYYSIANIGTFLGPPVAHFLCGWSWSAMFYGSALITALNLPMLLTYREIASGGSQQGGVWTVAKHTVRQLMQPRLAIFIVIMSGFWLMFSQLFDMLPNFIVDWVDSSAIVQRFHLPAMFTMQTTRGTMVAQEWMINANSGLIMICVVWVSYLAARLQTVHSLCAGVLVASLGMAVAGFSASGYLCLLGVVIFSVGEMLAAPKILEYLGGIAPIGQKGLYMGYSSMPWALGWALGALFAGNAYEHHGDKANLALRYLASQGLPDDVQRSEAVEALQHALRLDARQVTELLWQTYHPYELWYPFAAIGVSSAIGLWLYARWLNREGRFA